MEYNTDVSALNSGLADYRRAYEQAMAAQGVIVTWQPQDAYNGGPFTLVDPGKATLTKDGFSTEVVVSAGRATVSPQELAAFDIQYGLRFQAQIMPGDALPSRWYQPEGSRGNPGPTPTISPANPSTQPQQTPPNPPQGTIRNDPPAFNPNLMGPGPSTPLPVSIGGPMFLTPELRSQKMGFDQWNYFLGEQTGRSGPAPEDVGAQRGPLYTYDEWYGFVRAWLALNGITPDTRTAPPVGVPPPPPAPPAGGGTTTPPAGSGGSTAPPAGSGGSTAPPAGSPPTKELTPAQTSALVVGAIIFGLRLWR